MYFSGKRWIVWIFLSWNLLKYNKIFTSFISLNIQYWSAFLKATRNPAKSWNWEVCRWRSLDLRDTLKFIVQNGSCFKWHNNIWECWKQGSVEPKFKWTRARHCSQVLYKPVPTWSKQTCWLKEFPIFALLWRIQAEVRNTRRCDDIDEKNRHAEKTKNCKKVKKKGLLTHLLSNTQSLAFTLTDLLMLWEFDQNTRVDYCII